MILNDVWIEFNRIIRSQATNNDIARKLSAVNLGNDYLLNRMIELRQGADELLTTPTNVTTTISTNYITLPDDFVRLKKIYYLSGTDYIAIEDSQIYDYDRFLRENGISFFDTANTGDPSYIAIKEPYIYFDKHFSVSDTDAIKIIYFKQHTTIEAYDKLTLTGITGTFVVGETVTGGTSGAAATIHTVTATYIYVTTSTRVGTFTSGETITGGTSGATATQSGVMSEKVQTLLWSSKQKFMVAQAWAVAYLELIGSMEVQEKDAILTSMINTHYGVRNKGAFRIRVN